MIGATGLKDFHFFDLGDYGAWKMERMMGLLGGDGPDFTGCGGGGQRD